MKLDFSLAVYVDKMTQTGNVLTQLKNSQFDRETMLLAWVVKETGSGISGLELREAAPAYSLRSGSVRSDFPAFECCSYGI